MYLCQYKDLFGKPNEGIRRYRIANIAIFDTVIVIMICLMISYFSNIAFYKVFLVIFLLGIIAHRMFCVRTGIDKLLFSE
jgi:hypothetical protein